MKKAVLLPALLLGLLASGCAVQSVGVETPEASVRIGVRAYPDLVLVPGSPVYYAPWVDQNYFFYDGMYWVFQGDDWYASYWFNGPWSYVRVDYVPVFILRVPVYYYRRPPVYFRGWRAGEPPRWGERWGHDWEARHPDWRRHEGPVPAPAPRPDYQRRYSGKRYPAPAQQQQLQEQNYPYRPREHVELTPGSRPGRAPEQRQEPGQPRRQQEQGPARQDLRQERDPQGPMRPDGSPGRADGQGQGDRGRERRDADRQQMEQWRQQRENDRQIQEQWRQRQAPPFREPGQQGPERDQSAVGQERRGPQDERAAQWQERQRRQQEQDAGPESRPAQGRQPESAPQMDPRWQRRESTWPAPQRPEMRGDSPRLPAQESAPRWQRDPSPAVESAPRAPQWQRDVGPAPSRRALPQGPAVVAPAQDRGAPATGGSPGQNARPLRKETPSRKPGRGQSDQESPQEGPPGR